MASLRAHSWVFGAKGVPYNLLPRLLKPMGHELVALLMDAQLVLNQSIPLTDIASFLKQRTGQTFFERHVKFHRVRPGILLYVLFGFLKVRLHVVDKSKPARSTYVTFPLFESSWCKKGPLLDAVELFNETNLLRLEWKPAQPHFAALFRAVRVIGPFSFIGV